MAEQPPAGQPSEVETWPHTPGALTVICGTGQCGWCHGYIKPLESGVNRPCQHSCHDDGRGNPRNYECAVKWALKHQAGL